MFIMLLGDLRDGLPFVVQSIIFIVNTCSYMISYWIEVTYPGLFAISVCLEEIKTFGALVVIAIQTVHRCFCCVLARTDDASLE